MLYTNLLVWDKGTSYEESHCYFICRVSNEQTSYMKSGHARFGMKGLHMRSVIVNSSSGFGSSYEELVYAVY